VEYKFQATLPLPTPKLLTCSTMQHDDGSEI
jgi:hypothetical protein